MNKPRHTSQEENIEKSLLTWMYDAGIALIHRITTAGHGVPHGRPLKRTFTADDIILTASPAHHTPLGPWTVAVQEPVI